MATRADLRASLRSRLEDSTGTPLWSDANLNEALTQAMRQYGQRVPRQATASISVVGGTTAYALPADCRDDRIVELLDATGAEIPPRRDARTGFGPSTTTDEQAWWVWNDQLRLARSDGSGTWSLLYLATRELIVDDVSTQQIEPGHEPIVIALALAWCWDRRSSEDTKRGSRSTANRQREHAAAEAERLFASIKRNARGGWLS